MGIHCFTEPPERNRVIMFLLVSIFICQYIVSSLSMSVPVPQDIKSPYLIPVAFISEDAENYINKDNVNEDSIENSAEDLSQYSPSGEDILEALLTQLEYPEESEAIYNSLFNVDKKDEELAHQLSFLKSEDHPDITDRKYFLDDQRNSFGTEGRRRSKRSISIPPFVNDKTHKRMQQ